MNKFLCLVVLAFVASASAFTTVAPRSNGAMRPAGVMPQQAAPVVSTSSTSLNVLVDPAIVAMTAKSDPIGAVFMLCLVVSFWELVTPGRAKKA